MNEKRKVPSAPKSTFTPLHTRLLQRACACGGSPGIDGYCSECRDRKFTSPDGTGVGLSLSQDYPSLVQQEPHTVEQASIPGSSVSSRPFFGHDFSRVQVRARVPETIQTKLTVNQPGDQYEQEADQVAEQVMRMSETESVPREGFSSYLQGIQIQRLSPQKKEVRRQPEEEKKEIGSEQMEEEGLGSESRGEEQEETLQAKESPGHTHTPTVTPELHSRIDSLRGGGQPLPEATRAFMEPRFGHDFSQVRIHADERAAETARTVNAPGTPNLDQRLHAKQSSSAFPTTDLHHRYHLSAMIRKVDKLHGSSIEGSNRTISEHSTRPLLPLVSFHKDAMPGDEEPSAVEDSGIVPPKIPQITPTEEITEPLEGETVQLPDVVIGSWSNVSEDAISGTFAFNPATEQTRPEQILRPRNFGRTIYAFKLSKTTVTRTNGTFVVNTTIDFLVKYGVRDSKGPDDQVNIEKEDDPQINQENYKQVVFDLTPETTCRGVNIPFLFVPPRTKYWCRPLTLKHEKKHVEEYLLYGDGSVYIEQNWLGAQEAKSAKEVYELLKEVRRRIKTDIDYLMRDPEGEDRAYEDGLSSYLDLANSIKARGDAKQYPEPPKTP